jgi:hypothetical protein
VPEQDAALESLGRGWGGKAGVADGTQKRWLQRGQRTWKLMAVVIPLPHVCADCFPQNRRKWRPGRCLPRAGGGQPGHSRCKWLTR